MNLINKIEIALFISFALLLVYLIYTRLLRYWDKNRIMDQVIVANLKHPYRISGNQLFEFELSSPSEVQFSILKEDETHLITLIDEVREMGGHSLNFDCSTLNTGWYWYQLKTPNQNIIRKFKVVK